MKPESNRADELSFGVIAPAREVSDEPLCRAAPRRDRLCVVVFRPGCDHPDPAGSAIPERWPVT